MKLFKHWAFLFIFSLRLTSGNAAPRIAIAGISHETNRFNMTNATLADFEGEDALSGNRKEWLETNAKTNQNAAGMIAGAEKYGLDLYPIHFFNAVPRGPINTQGFNTMVDRILQGLKQPPGYEGVLLVLHGAMVVDGFPSGDAEIVRRIRQAIGPKFPIAVTHDFHANVDPAIITNADIVITGKECPHLDTKERGFQTASILARMIKGELKPVQAMVKPPMMLNLIHHDTYRMPLKPIVDASKEVEKKDRKSTRLNSSHLGISYAVFCLKKKIEKNEGRRAGIHVTVQDRSEHKQSSATMHGQPGTQKPAQRRAPAYGTRQGHPVPYTAHS